MTAGRGGGGAGEAAIGGRGGAGRRGVGEGGDRRLRRGGRRGLGLGGVAVAAAVPVGGLLGRDGAGRVGVQRRRGVQRGLPGADGRREDAEFLLRVDVEEPRR